MFVQFIIIYQFNLIFISSSLTIQSFSDSNRMNYSNLLIISHDREEFKLLVDVLKWYFPEVDDGDKESNGDMLMIKNKYYKAQVKMSNILWQQTQLFAYNTINDQKESQTEQLQSEQINKQYDLMIMVVNEQYQEQISFSQLDALIETINPEEFVLLVNTERPGDVWKYQEVILEKCNNFIQIVKDDLQQVVKSKPKWGGGALLNDDNEETLDNGVFSILDRMETTRWRNMVDMKSVKQQHNANKDMIIQQEEKIQKKEQTNEINPPDNSQQQRTLAKEEKLPTQQQHDSSDEQQQQKHQQQKPLQQQQLDQDQLQAEMLQFEQMMSQMISFKAQSSNMKDSERKTKAEELFMKMFEKMNY